MHKVVRLFDKLEDVIRGQLSRVPIVYAIIGGICVVLFWRGVWHTADIIMIEGNFTSIWHIGIDILQTKGILSFLLYEPINLILSIIILLMVGLLVSIFIGDQIIISGIKNEKKLVEKAEKDIEQEGDEIHQIQLKIKKIEILLNQIIEGRKE